MFVKNNKGFSLIELMVVVAIIAILSTIAIPSYQNFQAKARQKEGFGLLSGYFTAQQASRAEFGVFPGNFLESGFQPAGTLHYRVVAADNAGFVPPYGTRATAGECISTGAACTGIPALEAGNPFVTWLEAPAPYNPVATTGASACDNISFLVHAAGIVSTSGGTDEYSMNEDKALLMVQDGLN